MFNAIVVGADGSETARKAVETAARLAQNFGATLHIVSAYDAKSFEAPGSSEFRALTNESEVEALLQSLSFISKGQAVETEVHSRKGNPADALLDVAEHVGADLVVVGNRGMKGVRRVLGSVPNSVAHGAQCSVLIVDTVSE